MNYRERYSRLSKDGLHSKICGVCSGVARHYDLSRFGVRVVTLIGLIIAPALMLCLYFGAAILLPSRQF